MILRTTIIALIALVLGGCASGVEYVGKIDQKHFQGNAVLVGSIVSPDDSIVDVFFVRGLDSGETYRVMDQEKIQENNEHYEVGMFALVVPPGMYAYYSANHHQSAERGGASMTWTQPKLLVNEEVEAGDFIYVGRAFCEATRSGCQWSLTDESARDLPVLRTLNRNLPWQDIEVQP